MNRPKKNLPPELATLEAKLSELKPSTGRLDRDRLMYELGKAEAAPKKVSPGLTWKWTLGLTVTSNVAVALVMFLVLQSDNQINPSRATGLTDPAQQTVQKEVAHGEETNEASENIKPNKPQPPAESHGGWGNLLAGWFDISPTYERRNLSPIANRGLNDDINVYSPYARMIATHQSKPQRVITNKEKPAPRPLMGRTELMKEYFENEQNY